jgi:acyl carrier protein
MEEIKIKIKNYIKNFFRKHEIEDDENIFEIGFVNSLFAMQLVMFIEKEFSIRLESNDLDRENFKTINLIAKLIETKKNKL